MENVVSNHLKLQAAYDMYYRTTTLPDELIDKIIEILKPPNYNYTDENGLKQGIWTYFIWDDCYVKEAYKDGELHGIRRRWDYINMCRLDEMGFKDGKMHGLSRKWHSYNNISQEGYYKDGKLHGTTRSWRNGQLLNRSSFKDGKEHGKRECWHEGRLQYETQFKDGVEYDTVSLIL